MKTLRKIRLINWHYFADETIEIDGSCLITGENTAGKSTILDAIALVLTTNTRKFNTAANEKSKRNLKGYVRCKTGVEGEVYLRKGRVISYVALEFFEQRKNKAFTIGARIESSNEDSALDTKWYVVETGFNNINFVVDNKPALSDEFLALSKKVKLISGLNEARDRFGRRLGNLDARFFTMIPKSLAFKPMDKVKDFINKFILTENIVEVESLKNNINSLKELEDLMAETKIKIDKLMAIADEFDKYAKKENTIKINQILIKYARLEDIKQKINQSEKQIERYKTELNLLQKQEIKLKLELDQAREQLLQLERSIADNEVLNLIKELETQIKTLDNERRLLEQNYQLLQTEIDRVIRLFSALKDVEELEFSKSEICSLLAVNSENKLEIASKLTESISDYKDKYTEKYFITQNKLDSLASQKTILKGEIKELESKKLIYPQNTIQLKKAIEKEFATREIESKVYIFSELLEIKDGTWQDAIEGYLNNQRFYLIVEPKYYDIAAGVYHKIRKKVESVGLVNTEKLKLNREVDTNSLAYFVTSDNIYAQAYANYLLARVKCSDRLEDLKNHKIAITKTCMLYQNFALRKIAARIYQKPFIGIDAYKKQLALKQEELNELLTEEENLREEQTIYTKIKELSEDCRPYQLKEHLNVAENLETTKTKMSSLKTELKIAESNPTILELTARKQALQAEFSRIEKSLKTTVNRINKNEWEIESLEKNLLIKRDNLLSKETEFAEFVLNQETLRVEAIKKYQKNIKRKSLEAIIDNYDSANKGLMTSLADIANDLYGLQHAFLSAYQLGFSTGTDDKTKELYADELYRLKKSEIIKYEGQLAEAKRNCELEFKDSFIAKLKENIEQARSEFKILNKSLQGIYYGDDSYRFIITYNKGKESLYKMIMADENFAGNNLFSQSFEHKYKNEMDDLFDKLMANEDAGDKVIREYTDYRSYLDYDIEVLKKDGSKQKFSKIYGEKSGGETQVPYYVAIAASFASLYRLEDSIKIIMLDEAFDKMDEDRIAAMMDFFVKQNFQIILATPPAKMEIIGEKVDTIVLALRDGYKASTTIFNYLE